MQTATAPHQLPQSKTFIVAFSTTRPVGQLPLIRYGLKSVASDFAEVGKNLMMVRSRRSAEVIANALLPVLDPRDELRVVEVGEDVSTHNARTAWCQLNTSHFG